MKRLLPFLGLLLLAACAGTKSTRFAKKEFLEEQTKDSLLLENTDSLKGKKCHCSILPPFTLIGKGRVRKRFARFALKMSNTKQNLVPGVDYDPLGVVALLDTVTQSPKQYDGFRAYFAVFPEKKAPAPDCQTTACRECDSGYCYVPKDQYGKLTLIFVPTTQDPDTSDKHPDDVERYMLIDQAGVSIVPQSVVKMWVAKAQNGVLQTFETEGRTHRWHHKFRETHSLWYGSYALQSHPILKNGLLDILACRLCTHRVTSVHAGFGAFTGLIHGYKLTLVFTLINGNQTENFSLYATAATSGSDTGNPCPPPSKCSVVGDAASQ